MSEKRINPAEYEYFDDLTGDGWGWEFTRRNEDLRHALKDLSELLAPRRPDDKAGGCEDLSCGGCDYDGNREGGKSRTKYVPCAIDVATWIHTTFNLRFDRRYGCFFPDATTTYPDIPEGFRPVMSMLKSSVAVRGIKGTKIGNDIVRRIGHGSVTIDADGIEDLIGDVLSPRPVTGQIYRTLFVGIDLDATITAIREELEKLVTKHVRAKTQTGDARKHLSKWKSGLMLWDLRANHRIIFREAGKELRITEEKARKLFAATFQRITGKPYKPALFKKPEIMKEDLNNICSICPKRKTCTELCPKVAAYANQGTRTYQRDTLQDVTAIDDRTPESLLIQLEEEA